MKNSSNFGFVALLLIVLGCSCPKLNELKSGSTESSPTPFSTPFTTTAPTAKPTAKGNSITMAKYNQIKNGMKHSEVVEILGEEGTEMSNSEIGKYKTVTYKWEGENFSYIILTFQNDKLMFKSQANLK